MGRAPFPWRAWATFTTCRTSATCAKMATQSTGALPAKCVRPTCRRCGGSSLIRLVSRFAFHRSWGDSLNWTLSGETLTEVDEESFTRYDMEMPESVLETIDAARDGELPPELDT